MVMKKIKHYGEFCKFFGITPRNVILEFFLELRSLDFSASDVVKETHLNRATTYNTLNELVKEKLIISTRTIGKTQLYKLNMASSKVRNLINNFNNTLNIIIAEYEVRGTQEHQGQTSIASPAVISSSTRA
jgi:Fe2+ or Zn2+ uptake regulation protein